MTYRDRQRLADIQAAIDAVRWLSRSARDTPVPCRRFFFWLLALPMILRTAPSVVSEVTWLRFASDGLPNDGPPQDWGTGWAGIGTWQLTWVGLDVFEVAGLAATGYLLRRGHRQTRTAALLTAPVFIVDGWFDMLTAASRSDLAMSIAMLAVAELPTAVFLALIARKAREFETTAGGPAQAQAVAPPSVRDN